MDLLPHVSCAGNIFASQYPKPILSAALALDPTLMRRIWEILNRITPEQLRGEGRVYGGGLHKLEPKELANVPVPELAAMLPSQNRQARHEQMLFADLTVR